jgi:hypothetical protein
VNARAFEHLEDVARVGHADEGAAGIVTYDLDSAVVDASTSRVASDMRKSVGWVETRSAKRRDSKRTITARVHDGGGKGLEKEDVGGSVGGSGRKHQALFGNGSKAGFQDPVLT